jgi:hypothetical protein
MVDRGLIRVSFTCPHCRGLLIAQPDLLWVEPVEPDQAHKRLAELDTMRQSEPPPVPAPLSPTPTPWPDERSPTVPPTPAGLEWDIEPHSPPIDTGKAETKRKRREHEQQRKRRKNREELLGMLSFVVMAAFLLFLALSSCRMR